MIEYEKRSREFVNSWMVNVKDSFQEMKITQYDFHGGGSMVGGMEEKKRIFYQ